MIPGKPKTSTPRRSGVRNAERRLPVLAGSIDTK